MNIIEANVATPDARVAITIARFNNFINDSLLEGAIDALKRIGQVKDENITVVWVPGAYELPLAAGALAKTGKYDAVIALGTVIRVALPTLNMSLVVQATAWRMLPRTAKFRLLLGF
ncbi:6,7-dimethyl-8-ribityllumazine synthase [Escherichia coli]|uniref:6,7-dimethyl-8-ribityllumazine synthase n=1 Tax=Escherichia coli TaxID=562 RepID=A0A377E822_ECOLX|nr:6,7-dimethyl-8-ribityllumazine synthase [Escherichia coli]